MTEYWELNRQGYKYHAPRPTLDTLPLFDTEEENTIQARFEKFDAENPQVWERLTELMWEVHLQGIERWSVKAAFEVMRYESIRTNGQDFKLPNDYTSRYARKLLEHYPHFEGFIETRELKTK